jgi:hypothetical protein
MKEKYIHIILIFFIILLFNDLFNNKKYKSYENFNQCIIKNCPSDYNLINNNCIKKMISSLSTPSILSPLIISYCSKHSIFANLYSIIIININVIDINNVDVQYGFYKINGDSTMILGYDVRRFTYTNYDNITSITSIGDSRSGISIPSLKLYLPSSNINNWINTKIMLNTIKKINFNVGNNTQGFTTAGNVQI